ncbi:MAG: hypothetical protein AAF805_13350 [Planctomycetota bacterium]
MRITATDEPFGDRDYRSARLESRTGNGFVAGCGRVEVRATTPTSKGVWARHLAATQPP